MVRVVVVGGGWAGCAAAISARKAGGDVILLERTDMLLGTGLVGGIMRNNGRFTAAEEMIAMGGGDLFTLCDNSSRHKNIEFPGHKHASLYDIAVIHGSVMNLLDEYGIKVLFKKRISKVAMKNESIINVQDEDGNIFKGDVFIDATGTAGPMNNCMKYGNGCAMCILRCPSYGGRVSLAGLAGVTELVGRRPDGSYGAMSGSCKLYKESLSQEIQYKLNKKGVAVIPIPEGLIEDHLGVKACQQYALKEFKDNIILLDTGHAKLMAPYYDIEILRKIPGFENARYEDPYAGGKGNSMRYFAMSPRDNCMRVEGVTNLFCCGEKAGLLVGHTEAIVTGTLAGHNSVRFGIGQEVVEISTSLAVGDAIDYVNKAMTTEEGMGKKYTFSGSVYFERMKKLCLYTTDVSEVMRRVERAKALNIFSNRIVRD
ncbi:MAG: FAD-dependent oxidoreductase [Clostridia bacterium]|nr:FAD-dependent oxidoreductase [Clostridia bacterium]